VSGQVKVMNDSNGALWLLCVETGSLWTAEK
jgi:hypothetical protein